MHFRVILRKRREYSGLLQKDNREHDWKSDSDSRPDEQQQRPIRDERCAWSGGRYERRGLLRVHLGVLELGCDHSRKRCAGDGPATEQPEDCSGLRGGDPARRVERRILRGYPDAGARFLRAATGLAGNHDYRQPYPV